MALRREHVARNGAVDPQEAHVEHPLVGVDLREIAASGIGDQHHHDVVGVAFAGDGQRRVHGSAARSADQQALVARDPPRGEERVGVAHLDDPIDDRPVERGRPEVLTDALGQIGATGAAGIHRARRVGADNLHGRAASLQERPDAGDRPARADARDEMRDAAARLLPDPRAGRVFVRERVGGVRVLIGPERTRRLAHQSLGRRVVRARVLGRYRRRAHDDFCPVGTQQRDLLVAHLVAHHENAAVAALGGDDRQARARVARGRLNDRSARLEQSVALRRVDHGDRDSILDTATRIHGLDLGDERAPNAFGGAHAR